MHLREILRRATNGTAESALFGSFLCVFIPIPRSRIKAHSSPKKDTFFPTQIGFCGQPSTPPSGRDSLPLSPSLFPPVLRKTEKGTPRVPSALVSLLFDTNTITTTKKQRKGNYWLCCFVYLSFPVLREIGIHVVMELTSTSFIGFRKQFPSDIKLGVQVHYRHLM